MHKITWPADERQRVMGMNRFEAVDPARTALIVVDLQAGFVEPGYPAYCAHALDVVPQVNRLAEALRGAGGIVAFTRHTTFKDPERAPPPWQLARSQFAAYFASLEPDAPGHALHSGLDVRACDLVLDKTHYSAFLPNSSTLDAELRARGIDTVIITGTVTNICCESSARDAEMMGYKVFFIADANAAPSDAAHNAALATLGMVFADIRFTDEMAALIAAGARRPAAAE
jgi:ureidoacrylate peracid hydrolase